MGTAAEKATCTIFLTIHLFAFFATLQSESRLRSSQDMGMSPPSDICAKAPDVWDGLPVIFGKYFVSSMSATHFDCSRIVLVHPIDRDERI